VSSLFFSSSFQSPFHFVFENSLRCTAAATLLPFVVAVMKTKW